MKTTLVFAVGLVLALPGGDREHGMQLFAAGKYAEAAVAFRAAIASDGDSAELQWNLALACLRAGELDAAEVAAEKYAAMQRGARVDLHAGLLGAVRYAEAQGLANQALPLLAAGAQPPVAMAPPTAGQPAEHPADPLPLLEQALDKCKQGRDHFLRGAAVAPQPELQRNTERSLRLIAGLEKQIEELKKQREEQKKKNEPDQNQDKQKEQKKDDKQDEKKPDDKSSESKDKPEESADPKQEPKPQEPQPEDKPGESKPGEQPEDKPSEDKPKDGKPEDKPSQPQDKPEPKGAEGQGKDGDRKDAPGEGQEGREQSAEQAQRVQDNLQKQDQKRRELLLRQKAQRPRVERDW